MIYPCTAHAPPGLRRGGAAQALRSLECRLRGLGGDFHWTAAAVAAKPRSSCTKGRGKKHKPRPNEDSEEWTGSAGSASRAASSPVEARHNVRTPYAADPRAPANCRVGNPLRSCAR